MAIRRISELDRITADSLMADAEKMNQSLLEISRFRGEIDEVPSYYDSNSIRLDDLSAIVTEQVRKDIQNILTGDIEIGGDKTFTGDVTFNTGRDVTFGADVIINGALSVLGNCGPNHNLSYGAFFANAIHGTAMSARWSDLAELYETDREYEPGTIVMFGGDKELTEAIGVANAVITSTPGFVLGTEYGDGGHYQGIALVGRVPVKVFGTVRKFDRIYLSIIPGIGCTSNNGNTGIVVGMALKDKESSDIGLVECVVQLRI
jgi:hypothetical protein